MKLSIGRVLLVLSHHDNLYGVQDGETRTGYALWPSKIGASRLISQSRKSHGSTSKVSGGNFCQPDGVGG